jgi:hypothetical protein
VADTNNALLGDNRLTAEIFVYPNKGAVPPEDVDTCVQVTKKF